MNSKIIKKTYKKIDQIAKGGPDNIFLYKKYISDILDNKEYDVLYEVMLHYYDIDIHQYEFFDEIKNNTFEKVRLRTFSTYEENVKRLQKRLDFYNLGMDVITNSGNNIIGQIYDKGDVHYAVTISGTIHEVEGTDDFDIYNKSIEIIFSAITR